MHARPALELGTDNLWTLGAVGQARGGHADGHRLPRLLGDQGCDRPASDDRIHGSVHIAANPLFAADGQVYNHGGREPLGRVTGADAVLRLQIVQLLRKAETEPTYPVVPACRRIIGLLRYGVAAFEAHVVRGALLKTELHRVVPGIRALQHQALEIAGELRVLIQQICQGQGRLAVVGINFIEARVGRGRYARGIEHVVKRIANLGLKKIADAAIRLAGRVGGSDSGRNLAHQGRGDESPIVGARPG